MARDDQRYRISAEGLANRPREPGVAEIQRELAVGSRAAWRDPTSQVVDANVEVRDIRKVDREPGQILQLAPQMSHQRVDRPLNRRGEWGIDTLGGSIEPRRQG